MTLANDVEMSLFFKTKPICFQGFRFSVMFYRQKPFDFLSLPKKTAVSFCTIPFGVALWAI